MAIQKVNPEMLKLARELRSLTQKELSATLNITQGALSKYEKNSLIVPEEVIQKYCESLNFPSSFFSRTGRLYPPNLHYRKKAKVPKKLLVQAEATMNLHRLNVQELLESLEIDSDQVPKMDLDEHQDPETVATKLRAMWRIPRGPINNIFAVLENKGIIIIPTDFDSEEIDGRSMMADDGTLILFVNSKMPFDRQRFTVAHELGHMVMHLFVSVDEMRDIEKEANRFASEFLMPSDEIHPQLHGRLAFDKLADLKRYWRVSMQSILFKAKHIGAITPHQAKRMWIEIGKLGMRKREPIELDPPKEDARLLKMMLLTFSNELGYTTEDFSEMFALNVKEIKKMYFEEERPKFKVYNRMIS